MLSLALAVSLLSAPAAAQQSEERFFRDGNSWVAELSGPLSTEKALRIDRFVGSVQIVAGASSGSYLLRLRSADAQEKDARRQFSTIKLAVGRRSGLTVLQGTGQMNSEVASELTIQLPAGVEAVHVDTLAGKITIIGEVPHLDLQSHGGDIELDDAQLLQAVTMGGSVIINHRVVDSVIRTGGGDIRIDASTGDLDVTSLGGNIWMKAIARAQIESGGGNIEVVRCKGMLQIRSAGGNIKLGEMEGNVIAETGGGNIYVGIAHSGVIANTAVGNIQLWKLYQGAAARTGMGRITAEFVGDRNSMRNSQLVTLTGDIVVYFADSAPASVHAVTGTCPSRKIVSEFPDLKMTRGTDGPRSVMADGPIHGGGPALQLRTMAGQIELREVR